MVEIWTGSPTNQAGTVGQQLVQVSIPSEIKRHSFVLEYIEPICIEAHLETHVLEYIEPMCIEAHLEAHV